jgi:1-acyl-sn-glycerol-3-phosphate acyltransferase
MALLRSILFALIFYPGSLYFVLGAMPGALAGSRSVRRYAYRWARFHRWCTHHILNIRVRIEGVVPTEPVIVAAKHQSMFETIDMLVILDEPAVVLKQELTAIPLWGKVAAAHGTIPVDRAGSASALREMLRAARAAIAARRMILIFPEGTRVPPGQQPELRAGFAGLYRQLKLPVVPVAIDSGRLSPRNSFIKRPGVITFRFGETIPAGLSREDVEARVHSAINVLDR